MQREQHDQKTRRNETVGDDFCSRLRQEIAAGYGWLQRSIGRVGSMNIEASTSLEFWGKEGRKKRKVGRRRRRKVGGLETPLQKVADKTINVEVNYIDKKYVHVSINRVRRSVTSTCRSSFRPGIQGACYLIGNSSCPSHCTKSASVDISITPDDSSRALLLLLPLFCCCCCPPFVTRKKAKRLAR